MSIPKRVIRTINWTCACCGTVYRSMKGANECALLDSIWNAAMEALAQQPEQRSLRALMKTKGDCDREYRHRTANALRQPRLYRAIKTSRPKQSR